MHDERATEAGRAPRVLPPRRAAAAAMLGGVLWLLYGVLAMLQPWGADVAYSEAQGYSLVVNAALFLGYSLPGGLALALTSAGLIGIITQLRTGRRGRSASVLAYAALVLADLCLMGAVILFDPVFTAGRILGTVVLGVATVLAAVVAHKRATARAFVGMLLFVGMLGLFLLPLWPLVYAVQLLAPAQAVWFFVFFGLGWVGVGWRVWREDDVAFRTGPAPAGRP